VWHFALLHESESAPEGRNLHLQFHNFSRVTLPDQTSTAGGVTSSVPAPSTVLSTVHGAGIQLVMLWGRLVLLAA